MTDQVLYALAFLFRGATPAILYLMPMVPFLIWSIRATMQSGSVEVGGKPRQRPGIAATLFLLVLPVAFLVYYKVSHADMSEDLASEWRPWLFLCIPPAIGMVLGYMAGLIWQLLERIGR